MSVIVLHLIAESDCILTPFFPWQIPKDVLLEVLGPSKVYMQVIKRAINSTVAEYVEKVKGFKPKFGILNSSFQPLQSKTFKMVLNSCLMDLCWNFIFNTASPYPKPHSGSIDHELKFMH